MSADDYVIEIEGLLNMVGSTVLHRNLDFRMRRGEVVSLVGGSGSGKTQLLRVILGLKRHALGSAILLGFGGDKTDIKAGTVTRSWPT